MKNTSVFEANQRFAMERKEIVADYNSTVAELQQELSLKVGKLKNEKERKLLDVARRQDEFNEKYRQWKEEQKKAMLAAEQETKPEN